MGIINGGTAIGAMIAPPAIAAIIATGGWRWVFFAAGSAGLLWTLWWARAYFSAADHPRLSSKERQEIQEVLAAGRQEKGMSWLQLFSFRETWGIVGAKFLSDSAWYFYLRGCPSIYTTCEALTPSKSVITPGYLTPPPVSVVWWEAGSRAGC
jgi:ACS family hexuronate transporter-like MFS transporter